MHHAAIARVIAVAYHLLSRWLLLSFMVRTSRAVVLLQSWLGAVVVEFLPFFLRLSRIIQSRRAPIPNSSTPFSSFQRIQAT